MIFLRQNKLPLAPDIKGEGPLKLGLPIHDLHAPGTPGARYPIDLAFHARFWKDNALGNTKHEPVSVVVVSTNSLSNLVVKLTAVCVSA